MNEQEINLLTEKYDAAKDAYQEVIHRAENKRTGGQIIGAEERFKTLKEICIDFGIIEKA